MRTLRDILLVLMVLGMIGLASVVMGVNALLSF